MRRNNFIVFFMILLLVGFVSAKMPIYTWTNQVNRTEVEELMFSIDWDSVDTDKLSSVRFDHRQPAVCRKADIEVVDGVVVWEKGDRKCTLGLFTAKLDSSGRFLEGKIEVLNFNHRSMEQKFNTTWHEVGHLEGYNIDNRSELFAEDYEYNIWKDFDGNWLD